MTTRGRSMHAPWWTGVCLLLVAIVATAAGIDRTESAGWGAQLLLLALLTAFFVNVCHTILWHGRRLGDRPGGMLHSPVDEAEVRSGSRLEERET